MLDLYEIYHYIYHKTDFDLPFLFYDLHPTKGREHKNNFWRNKVISVNKYCYEYIDDYSGMRLLNIFNSNIFKLFKNINHIQLLNGGSLNDYGEYEFRFDLLSFLSVIECGSKRISYHIKASRGVAYQLDIETWLSRIVTSSLASSYNDKQWNITYKKR